MHRRAFSTGPSSLSESAGDWNEYLDVLRHDLWRDHPQVNIIDFEQFTLSAFTAAKTATISS